MDNIELSFDGKTIAGFDEAQISLSLGEIAGFFSFKLPDRSGQKARGLNLPENDSKVTLAINGSPVLIGYVEVIETEAGSSGFVSYLHGREITADLVDSSLSYSKVLNGPIDKVIREIIAPFHLELNSYSQKPVRITTQKGESVWKSIETLSRKTGDIIWTNGDGKLNIGYGKREAMNAVLNQNNIVSARSRFSTNELHSEYSVMAMTPSNDNSWGDSAKKTVTAKGTSKRYRPLFLKGEQNMNPGEGQQRALWEASIREARSISAEVSIAGFKIGKDPARINSLIDIDYPPIGIKNKMLISSIKYSYSKDAGGITTLGLSMPDAYKPEPFDSQKALRQAKKNIGWQP